MSRSSSSTSVSTQFSVISELVDDSGGHQPDRVSKRRDSLATSISIGEGDGNQDEDITHVVSSTEHLCLSPIEQGRETPGSNGSTHSPPGEQRNPNQQSQTQLPPAPGPVLETLMTAYTTSLPAAPVTNLVSTLSSTSPKSATFPGRTGQQQTRLDSISSASPSNGSERDDKTAFLASITKVDPSNATLVPQQDLEQYLRTALDGQVPSFEVGKADFLKYWMHRFRNESHVAIKLLSSEEIERYIPLSLATVSDAVQTRRLFVVFRPVTMDEVRLRWWSSKPIKPEPSPTYLYAAEDTASPPRPNSVSLPCPDLPTSPTESAVPTPTCASFEAARAASTNNDGSDAHHQVAPASAYVLYDFGALDVGRTTAGYLS